MATQERATVIQFCEKTQKTLERFNVFCALNNIKYKDLDTLYPVLGTKSSFHELTQEDYLRISPEDGDFLYENRQKFLEEDVFANCLHELSNLFLYAQNNSEKRGPGRPKGESLKQKSGKTLFVYDFLKNLLVDKEHSDLVTWENQSLGKFKIVNSVKLAKLWSQMKKSETLSNLYTIEKSYRQEEMTWGKFSRAIRYHYSTTGRLKGNTERMVYEFAGETLKELYEEGICTGVDIKKVNQEIDDLRKRQQEKSRRKSRDTMVTDNGKGETNMNMADKKINSDSDIDIDIDSHCSKFDKLNLTQVLFEAGFEAKSS